MTIQKDHFIKSYQGKPSPGNAKAYPEAPQIGMYPQLSNTSQTLQKHLAL